MNKTPALILAALLLSATAASATTFTVINVNPSGPGSLRQAILDANATPGADTINFNIPGSGVQTIAPTNALPDITNAVTINGYSQPGSSPNTLTNGDNAVILIRLDGFKTIDSFPDGLSFAGPAAGGSSVRGLCIVRFSKGIAASEASNLTIAGNWIGMDADGIARGMTFEGVWIDSFFNTANNITIGGTAPADRNVISGNRQGIAFNGSTTSNSSVLGNFIGTDPSGTLPRGNVFAGISIQSSLNLTIGGAAAGARNILSAGTGAGATGVTVLGGGGHLIQGNLVGTDVSGQYDLGNSSDGILLQGAVNNRIIGNQIVNNRANGINLLGANGTVIENNLIGSDVTGTRPLGNALAGVTISGSTNRIGGLGAGQPNTIQFNGGAGVEVTSSLAVQDEISGNSIYDNGGLGIDLYPAGLNTNDVLDADSGANGMQNYPVLTSASIAFSSLTVQGALNSKPGATYRLEFFATPAWDPTNIPEGKVFLGSTNVATDGGGNFNFSAPFAATPDTNWLITATATDAKGNTSEFSAGAGIVSNGVASPSLAVTSNVTSGGGGGGTTTTSVSWPSAATFFSLEKANSLNPPIQWQPVTSGIVDAGGTKTFNLTNSTGTSNQFFRLKKP